MAPTAYAGFAITLVSAVIAHLAGGGGVGRRGRGCFGGCLISFGGGRRLGPLFRKYPHWQAQVKLWQPDFEGV
jgi:hypothetical protein